MGFWFVVCSGAATPARVTCKKNHNNRKIKFWDPAINICRLILLDQILMNILNINRRSR